LAHGRGVFCKGSLLVVKRDETGTPEDSFAQPTQPEHEKKRTDGELKDVERDVGERRSEYGEDEEEDYYR
jgi:hypothetical protein